MWPMKRFHGSAAIFLFTMVMTVNAALRIHVAKDMWVTAGVGKGTDSVWYCDAAYQDLLNGTIVSDSEWVDSIYNDTVRNVFSKELTFAPPLSKYLVIGIADSFIVPLTGQYTFTVDALGAMFVLIDGQLLTPADNSVFLYPNVGDPLAKGEPSASDYKATCSLTQGNHRLTFYFWKGSTVSSLAKLSWTVPGGQDTVAIPSSVFGIRKNYGPLDVPDLITFGPAADSLADMPTLASGSRMYFGVKHLPISLMQGETLFYCWKVDGAVVKRTPDTLWDTIYLNTTGTQIMHVATYWAETSLGRISVEGGSSSTSFYINPSAAVRNPSLRIERSSGRMPEFLYTISGKRVRVLSATSSGIPAGGGIFLAPPRDGAAAQKLLRVHVTP
jgi:hypothetical protein